MAIWRGIGGSGESTNDSTVSIITSLLNDAEVAKEAAELAETNAETAATNAASSASTASTQASNAASSASSAASSASSASTSASNAATSASTASTQASNAATSATNAASSATSASSSATSAASSASTATTQASNAASSATSAASSASSASTSATSAASSASTATTQANNAATSASNAASSATSAASSASAAAASYDSFDDRYLGSKSSSPTVDNDGNTLLTGALYFDTTSNTMKVWNGSAWLDAYATLSGALLATNNLSDLNSASSARTNLGLGTAATQNSTAFATAAQGTNADTAFGWGNHALAGYAADSAVVKLTGNQTVAGVKTLSSNPILSAGTANGVTYLNGSNVLTSGSALTFNGTSLTFGSTGQRIIADMSNATLENRFAFQTSTANSSTIIGLIPSGTGSASQYQAYNGSDVNNAGRLRLAISTTAANIAVDLTGTGSYVPLTFITGGSERGRFDTSGNLGIGTSSPSYRLDVSGTMRSNQDLSINNAVTVTTNAGTVPVTSKLNTFTNSSAAAMTITMATASAVDGQMAIVRIYDFSAVAQTISWVNTENSTVTAPTTSNGSTTLPLTVGFMYNAATSKWRCIASA